MRLASAFKTDEALANAENATEAVDPEFVWMVEEPESSSELEPEAELETEAVGDLDWLSELEPEEASVSDPESEPEAETS